MPSRPKMKSLNPTVLAIVSIFMGAPAMAEDVKIGPVTLINAFEVPADKVDETVAFWERSRDFLQQQPGYISTRLHQAISPDAKFQLINVAEWESPAAFQEAIRKMRESNPGADARETVFHAALYRVIRTDEDIE